MRAKAKEALGIDLPAKGEYAVANVFFPPENPDVLKDCKAVLERLTKQRVLEVLGWRPVPVDNSMLGQDPLDSEPDTEQFFVANNSKYSARDFERELFRVRKMAEEEAAAMLGPESGFYINSLSSQTITYKGQLTPEQVSSYYLDIKDKSFISHLSLVHSRFSTNTFHRGNVPNPSELCVTMVRSTLCEEIRTGCSAVVDSWPRITLGMIHISCCLRHLII